jgi:hypothetical protein
MALSAAIETEYQGHMNAFLNVIADEVSADFSGRSWCIHPVSCRRIPISNVLANVVISRFAEEIEHQLSWYGRHFENVGRVYNLRCLPGMIVAGFKKHDSAHQYYDSYLQSYSVRNPCY